MAKKAKKVLEMAKVISTADIDFVSTVLHPNDHEAEDIDIERQMVDDPDINLNRFFHKGTSNTTEMRRHFVKKRKSGVKEESHIDPEELDGLLQLLNVSPATVKSSADEKDIVADLRTKIEDDLFREQHERDLMMERKAGFWRWASKKAYKRLVQNGRIWSEKESDSASSKNYDIDVDTTSVSSAALGGADDEEATEPDAESNGPPEESVANGGSKFMLEPTPKKTQTPRKLKIEDNAWTTVGKPGKLKTPTGNFKLVHNKGLGKIANSPSYTTTNFYGGYDEESMIDDDSEY